MMNLPLALLILAALWMLLNVTIKPRVYVKVHPKPQRQRRSRVRYRLPHYVGSDQVQQANAEAAA